VFRRELKFLPANAIAHEHVSDGVQPVDSDCQGYFIRKRINFPTSGKGPDYAQAGLLIYGDDANFVRADVFNNNDTRQVEFIKAETAEKPGYPTWGATNLSPAAINSEVTVWMRIVKRNVDGKSHYTAYSSNDGAAWTRGGTWVHALGNAEKICLYAGNQSGFTATFRYVHVSTVE
jgi:arabinan endo-1,5-alpha-L-arabinosidase